MEDLYTTTKAAQALGVSDERIRRLCDLGHIRHIRDLSGRRLIPASEIQRLQREGWPGRRAGRAGGGTEW